MIQVIQWKIHITSRPLLNHDDADKPKWLFRPHVVKPDTTMWDGHGANGKIDLIRNLTGGNQALTVITAADSQVISIMRLAITKVIWNHRRIVLINSG